MAASPILFKMPGLLSYGQSGKASSGSAEFADKLHTMVSTYDGSYFYRLMDAGAAFGKCFKRPLKIGPSAGLLSRTAVARCLLPLPAGVQRSASCFARSLLLA